jgi:Methyltransferase domain
MMAYRYDDRFLDYAANTSDYAARKVIAALQVLGPIDSILDIGCARGTWLRAWSQAGASEICGVDGHYADTGSLLIDRRHFVPTDLTAELKLGRQFDLVESLEVAEHLPESASGAFVASLVHHSRGLVLFSAAPPGQGGEHHINEQPYDYWRNHFRAWGYRAVDWVRPRLAGDRMVSFWYRYNVMLYVSDQLMSRLPDEVRQRAVPNDKPIADIAPLLFKIRKRVVRPLPRSAIMGLARIKAHFHS